MALRARPGCDEGDQAVVHRLASARKAPKAVVERCRMVELSWDGWLVPQIAGELRCSQRTVRRWLHRFNRSGVQGLEDLGGQGRGRRITEVERSKTVGLVRLTPPGRLEVQPPNGMWASDESGPPERTLDTLTAAARDLGIEVSRSQVRRSLPAEGVRRRRTRSWTRSKDPDFESGLRIRTSNPDFEGKRHGSSTARRWSAPTSPAR
ncbi:helix-turn-helix domain-containing protein [Streptomyces sp. NPDC056161]|uniref:helix-turn-helix domain-containing protein n=1 Tax=Streptomyces sp. NPDC056161 TaxID=3345732 RepID=UPI0035E16C99